MAHGPNTPWLSVEQLNARVEEAFRQRDEVIAELARINAELLAACKVALAYIPGSEVRSWPPGLKLKADALDLLRVAIAHAEGQP